MPEAIEPEAADDPDPLRILHVDAERGFSGGEAQVFLLLEGLRRLGLVSELACPPGSAAEEEARRRGFGVRPIPMRNDLDVLAVSRLARAVRDGGFDLVHLHTGRATWLGGLAARRAGVPAITTRRMDRAVRPGRRTRRVYGQLVRRAVAIAPAVADCLRAGGVPEERIRVIPSTVDPGRFAAVDGGARERLRAELLGEGSADVVVFLVLAALVPRKGHATLLAAFARLREPGRARLWIAGDGPERARLEAQAADTGLADRVAFLGRRADAPELLAACDVAVLPSLREGLGVAALEAMAAGRPVLASDVGGLGQAVVDGVTGRLVPPGDVDRWARELELLARDPGLRAHLGGNGPAHVAHGFSSDQMASAYAALYREVLAEA